MSNEIKLSLGDSFELKAGACMSLDGTVPSVRELLKICGRQGDVDRAFGLAKAALSITVDRRSNYITYLVLGALAARVGAAEVSTGYFHLAQRIGFWLTTQEYVVAGVAAAYVDPDLVGALRRIEKVREELGDGGRHGRRVSSLSGVCTPARIQVTEKAMLLAGIDWCMEVKLRQVQAEMADMPVVCMMVGLISG